MHQQQTHQIKYLTKIINIDVDTGEEITKQIAERYYSLLKIKKDLTYAGKYKTTRVITYTKLYRTKSQLELF